MMKMSKILIKVNNEKDFICPADGYILGLEKFSICFNLRFKLDELIELRKKYSDKNSYHVALFQTILKLKYLMISNY